MSVFFDWSTTDWQAFFRFMDEGIQICRYYWCQVLHPTRGCNWSFRPEFPLLFRAELPPVRKSHEVRFDFNRLHFSNRSDRIKWRCLR